MSGETIVRWFIPIALGIMMFAMGLGLTIADFRRIAERPLVVAAGSLAQLVGLPALGFLVAFLFRLDPPVAVGLILVTACPGGPTSNLYTLLARGDVALSVTLTAVSSVVTIFTLPWVVNLAGLTFVDTELPVSLPVIPTMLNVAAVMAFPLGSAMLLRHTNPAAAIRIEPIMQKVAIGILAILVVGAVLKEKARIIEYAFIAGAASITLGLLAVAFGFAVAKLIRQDNRVAVTFGIEVGMQNAALAIGLALGLLNDGRIAIPGVVYGILAYAFCATGIIAGRYLIPAPTSEKSAA
jgi:BASS family bile acid:Na+ symporter